MKKEKCKDCVWTDKVNDDLIFCIFPICLKGERENVNIQEIYKICDGFDEQDRKTSIKKLKRKGYSEETTNIFYNI